MARWPAAIWQPVAQAGGALRPITVTLHHQAGSGNPAPVYASRNVSAHFWLPRTAQPVQHVDSERQAWHGVAHNSYGLGVETEGCGSPPHADPLTEHQLDCFAELMRWANRTHGIPLVRSEHVSQPGLNYHRCPGGPATSCPCDIRLSRRDEILRRAGASGPTPPAPPTEEVSDNMVLRDEISGGVWVADRSGAVFSYDGAPYCGGANNPQTNPQGFPCVGIAPHQGGYLLVLDFGRTGGDRFRRYHFRRP